MKISDFGQSVIASRRESHAKVPCRIGTRLLNAPEIRNGSSFQDPLFDIEAALRTDVFSFGLLAWEVLKCGQSFFESAWVGGAPHLLNVDDMEDALNAMTATNLLDVEQKGKFGLSLVMNVTNI